MAKKGVLSQVIAFLMWVVGLLVSLAVGFAMINGTLVVPGIEVATQVAGYIVVIVTIVGVVMAIIDKLK